MITKLELTNFRQHSNLSLEFSKGVTVIRGANECGKSTVFEAITFALFGVDACRSNDLTTWGAPDKSHVVKVEFEVDGQVYHVTRSAKGAELNTEGVKVTGQREVTKRCEQVLDLRPGTGVNLMFASQNAVRGTLDEGSKSIQLIEQLADFDVVESYIRTLQTNYSLGKFDHLETQIDSLVSSQEPLQKEIESLPDAAAFEKSESERLNAEAESLLTQESSLREKQADLIQKITETCQIEDNLNTVKHSISGVEQNLKYLQTQLDEPAPVLIDGRLSNDVEARKDFSEELIRLKTALSNQQQLNTLWSDYQSFKLSSFNYDQYRDKTDSNVKRLEGTEESIKEELASKESELDTLTTQMQSLQVDKQSLERQLCTDLVCPTCKREWDDAAKMVENNNQIKNQIAAIDRQLAALTDSTTSVRRDISKLREVLHQPISHPAPNSLWQQVNDGHFPTLYTWTGPEPTEPDPKLEPSVRQYEVVQKSIENWEAKQATLNRQIDDASKQLTELNEQRALMIEPEISSDELRVELNNINVSLNDIQHRTENVQKDLNELPSKVSLMHKIYNDKLNLLEENKRKVEQYKVDIKDIQLNNALLKALREIKPKLANTIWQQVCNTISNYFSTMRDQQSVVSRSTAGFEVDGHNTKALSGSTLDVLGIAIRVALTKTFLPTCRFMLLDEPFAACDVERQMKALGFITSAGFDQVIIVTHEDTTEAVADNLITL